MKVKTTFLLAICLLFLSGCKNNTDPTKPENPIMNSDEKIYNDSEVLKYAKYFNTKTAENHFVSIWWDVHNSEGKCYIDRTNLCQQVPDWAETIMSCYTNSEYNSATTPDSVFNEEDAWTVAQRMKTGWNLGNSLDSHSMNYVNKNYYDGNTFVSEPGEWVNVYSDDQGHLVKGDGWIKRFTKGTPSDFEKGWKEIVTTKKLISFVKSLGFNVIRVPVSWGEHLNDKNEIDPVWMKRVKEVVDYVIDSGMYCIINVHHDGGVDGWIKAGESSYNQFNERFSSIWKQIADTFNNYDEHLLFESMNEVINESREWDNITEDGCNWINKWNQLFVDTVRETGGNNTKRNLIVMNYGAKSNDNGLKYFVLPTDSVESHLLLEIHNYNPSFFCSTNATWTTMSAKYSKAVEDSIDNDFAILKKYSDKLKVPIVIGEYAAFRKKYEDFGESYSE